MSFGMLYLPHGFFIQAIHVPVCWNGRRGGLKIRCSRERVGSSPTTGTKVEMGSQEPILVIFAKH